MIVVPDLEQGSPEWFAARAGRATSSCFSDVMAKGKGKTRASYLRKVIAERLTGKVAEGFRNRDTDRGQEQEPLACLAYEAHTDELLERVGFIQHDTLMAGCSPDRLVSGKRKGVEVKCVLPHIQIETVLSGGYPSEHRAQVQGGMWITGFDEWDFVSYSPEMPRHRRLYVHTVKRDDVYIKTIDAEVNLFLQEVDRLVDFLLGKEQDIEALLRQSIKEAA